MITPLWKIETLWVKPVEGSLTDVVVTADWRCNGTETTGSGDTEQTYSGTCYGSCSFAPPTEGFTPYDQLTEQQVLDWCFSNGVDKTAIEANVTAQINDQINPPVVVLPLPWVPEEISAPITPATLKPNQIVDPLNLPTSDVPPSVDGMTTNILG